ncbi:MAG: CDP-alcohol phosphatidyltransferase family protein [Clostridiales bacterium]|nr:CDP-alcohol phosphatidyltransferase family protein [Clostridiales bacterium]
MTLSMKRIPDIITFLRIAAAVMLLFTTPFSIIFYLLYSWCGFSDILDGYLARKKRWSSDFGAKWDSFADIVFAIIMFIVFIPILAWTRIILYGIGIVIAFKLLSLIIGLAKFHTFAYIHTYLNKATGLILFSFPFLYPILDMGILAAVLWVTAIISATEECLILITSTTWDSNRKSLWKK